MTIFAIDVAAFVILHINEKQEMDWSFRDVCENGINYFQARIYQRVI